MTGALLIVTWLSLADAEPILDRRAPLYRTGLAFRESLDRGMSVSWKNVPRRDVFRRVADNLRVALLLDRRIDPTATVDLDAAQLTGRGVLDRLSREAAASCATIGNTVYVGPPERAALLEALVKKRAAEFSWIAPRLPFERQRELARRTIHWNDLDSSTEIVAEIANEFGLEIEGMDLVPHDLWASWTLPEASASEALSLALIQFDLTFDWIEEARGIRIVPVASDTPVEAEYAVADAAALATELRRGNPNILATPRGDRISIKGTFADLSAAMPAITRVRVAEETRAAAASNAAPLSRREYTLRLDNVRASAVMRQLAESGTTFEYDAAALAAAGIDLDTPIRMDVEKAPAEEFFRAMFDPLGVRFTLDGTTVRLAPK
ncbi:MAG: hypothetical protein WD066_17175 [Planctomycetaceae bacterium]